MADTRNLSFEFQVRIDGDDGENPVLAKLTRHNTVIAGNTRERDERIETCLNEMYKGKDNITVQMMGLDDFENINYSTLSGFYISRIAGAVMLAMNTHERCRKIQFNGTKILSVFVQCLGVNNLKSLYSLLHKSLKLHSNDILIQEAMESLQKKVDGISNLFNGKYKE